MRAVYFLLLFFRAPAGSRWARVEGRAPPERPQRGAGAEGLPGWWEPRAGRRPCSCREGPGLVEGAGEGPSQVASPPRYLRGPRPGYHTLTPPPGLVPKEQAGTVCFYDPIIWFWKAEGQMSHGGQDSPTRLSHLWGEEQAQALGAGLGGSAGQNGGGTECSGTRGVSPRSFAWDVESELICLGTSQAGFRRRGAAAHTWTCTAVETKPGWPQRGPGPRRLRAIRPPRVAGVGAAMRWVPPGPVQAPRSGSGASGAVATFEPHGASP